MLHSHLNHVCAPNLSVRHLDQRNALSRITVVAKADIASGEEANIFGDEDVGVEDEGDGEERAERCKRA